MSTDDTAQPFSGVRILDFTRYHAGPYGTYQLGLLGADVVKVEPPGGEEGRRTSIAGPWSEWNLSPSFMALNANKRSITVDMKHADGIEIVKRLARDVDVVWENYRPGVMDRLGVGYDVLAEINPRLIYCSVSGFGTTGPERETAAFDGKVQAMSGLMSITGDPAGGPMRAGFPLADATAALTAAFAVSSALYQRTRTGIGQFVDVSMFDSMLSLMADRVAAYTVSGLDQQQFGNHSTSGRPTGDRFRCGDGYLMFAVMTEKQFGALFRTLGRADVLEDPRFENWAERSRNQDALRKIIEDAMDGGDPKEWEARLTAADVPCASILSIAEAVNHPQLAHRKVMQNTETPFGTVKLAGAGFELAHGGASLDRPPPLPGQHTDEVLSEAGYSTAQIDAFRQIN